MLLAQLDPILVQLTSIKCCNLLASVLKAGDSVVYKIHSTTNLMEFTVHRDKYHAKIQNL